MRFWIALALSATLLGGEGEGIRRVKAHLLIQDKTSALEEAEDLYRQYPQSKAVATALIEALSVNGREERALSVWKEQFSYDSQIVQDRHLLEELSWGILTRGMESPQFSVRFASLIGAYLTNDARAIPVIRQMMRDSHAVIRSAAIQMASHYGDAVLKEEIVRLYNEERVWMVRLEVIRAIGRLRIRELAPRLQALLASEKNTYEERAFSIEALVSMYDQINQDEFQQLARSNRAGMRQFACHLASHFRFEEGRHEIYRLAADPHPDVRVAALNAIGLTYLDPSAKDILEMALRDPEPTVAITAAWAVLQLDQERGEAEFVRHLESELPEVRRLAGAALAASGRHGIHLGSQMLSHADPYVRANIALGLVGQRVEVERCSDIFFTFLDEEKQRWMWDERANPLFQVLAPSQVRYIDQIPNYPEAIDQLTRLQLVSLLAILEDPRAIDALKSFLAKRNWVVTGLASATLLQEGDESSLEVVRSLTHDSDSNVALQASLVLAFLGRDESVIPELYKAYSGGDHNRKMQILEALGRIGKTETIPFLLQVFDEPFPLLRVAAAAAMIEAING